MAVDIQSEIDIERPIEVVSEFSANPDNVKIWYRNIHTVKWITDKPLAVGSKIAFIAHFLGRELSYTYEIIEFEPASKLVMRTAEGPFPMETIYTWQSDGSSTHMTLRNRGEPKGFSRFAAPIMSLAIKKATQKDLMLLKEILEKEGA